MPFQKINVPIEQPKSNELLIQNSQRVQLASTQWKQLLQAQITPNKTGSKLRIEAELSLILGNNYAAIRLASSPDLINWTTIYDPNQWDGFNYFHIGIYSGGSNVAYSRDRHSLSYTLQLSDSQPIYIAVEGQSYWDTGTAVYNSSDIISPKSSLRLEEIYT